MPTQAQIVSALQITGSYSLISGAATITDNTNWASIGVASPDTVKVLLYIQDSGGNLFYKNAGYDAADFTNPDLLPIGGTPSYSFTLPTDITGAYLTGQYTINEKVQVVQGSDTTTAYKPLYQNVVAQCNGIVPNVQGVVSYNTAQVSVVDSTNYKTWTALANTLSLYPPPQTGQATQTDTFAGSPATLLYVPPTGHYPYTGVWTWTLSSQVTYTDPTTAASTTCLITAQGTFSVIQSQLCKVLCYLKKYRANVQVQAANSQTIGALAKKNLLEAEGEYMLAFAAERCGRPQSEIDVYVASVYALIGETPDSGCDCGCDDGVSQPLVPTSIINGANGTNGTVIYSGTGVPSGGLGVVGDFYINTNSPYSFYKKTGATTWAFMFSTLGATGAAGAAGANGVAVVKNQITNSSTGGTALEILKTYAMPINTLATDGSYLEVRARISTSTASSITSTKLAGIYFNGNLIQSVTFTAANIDACEFVAYIHRFTFDEIKVKSNVELYYSTIPLIATKVATGFASQAGLNLGTIAYDITVEANSDVVGDLTCENLTVTLYTK